MGKLRRIVVAAGTCIAVLALLGGCAKKRSLQRPVPSHAVEQPTPAARESMYGADGELKGSPERVEWLEIPLAFQKTQRSYARHIVLEASSIRLDKARDFLSQRMLTGSVEEKVGTVFYTRALPPSGGNAVPLNVRLTERHGSAAGTIDLDIERLTYEGAQPVSEDEAKRLLADEQKHAH